MTRPALLHLCQGAQHRSHPSDSTFQNRGVFPYAHIFGEGNSWPRQSQHHDSNLTVQMIRCPGLALCYKYRPLSLRCVECVGPIAHTKTLKQGTPWSHKDHTYYEGITNSSDIYFCPRNPGKKYGNSFGSHWTLLLHLHLLSYHQHAVRGSLSCRSIPNRPP